jgi:exonuclease III
VYETDSLSILSWNIRGRMMLNMSSASCWSVLKRHDIVLFQETHLWPKQHENIRLPEGWSMISLTRPAPETNRQHGGICVLHRSSIPVELLTEYSTCDVMVLLVHSLTLVNVYIPPEQSTWLAVPSTPPEDHLYLTLASLSEDVDREVLMLGDFNARTGEQQSN